jgi:protein-disulfide isomerase
MRSPQRDVGLALIAFTTATGANPTNVVDEQNLISDTIVYAATGKYTITLNQQYLRVRAVAEIEDTTGGIIAKVVAHVEGTAATNTVTVHIEQEDGTGGNTNAKVVNVLFFLRQS